ncbi:hypothetical protein ABID21_002230 [Pseudorhizobium tarimense]|uniref:Uncharacterized protein n=1 Tax=Pseudorhizobium tarimense TaxID=1079109 RepID=A0ABV2H6E9_9HYPH|nr:hypothetical protein [Pseudorhizobium tarimense]MCJ8519064.1 hypothetical protein [Pseudorhizobium tarimense]
MLLAHVKAMQETADKIACWRGHAFELPIVSLGADAWIAAFVTEHTREIRGPQDRSRLCCQRHHGGIDFTARWTLP